MDMYEIDEKEIIMIADQILDKGLGTPALFFLDMAKYVSFIGSQLMIFLGPVITVFIQSNNYYKFASLLEDRANVEILLRHIEKKLVNE